MKRGVVFFITVMAFLFLAAGCAPAPYLGTIYPSGVISAEPVEEFAGIEEGSMDIDEAEAYWGPQPVEYAGAWPPPRPIAWVGPWVPPWYWYSWGYSRDYVVRIYGTRIVNIPVPAGWHNHPHHAKLSQARTNRAAAIRAPGGRVMPKAPHGRASVLHKKAPHGGAPVLRKAPTVVRRAPVTRTKRSTDQKKKRN